MMCLVPPTMDQTNTNYPPKPTTVGSSSCAPHGTAPGAVDEMAAAGEEEEGVGTSDAVGTREAGEDHEQSEDPLLSEGDKATIRERY